MGDSGSACITQQPFCYASGLSDKANESNPIHALSQSVSFGRFVTDSLAWEKWSTFSQNRYVEEAERFSRPGSVLQKKAFFEAHYKKLAAQKAAALLEQANNAATQTKQEDQEAEVDRADNSETASPKSKLVTEENAMVWTSEPDSMLGANGYNSNSNIEPSLGRSNKLEDVDSYNKPTEKQSYNSEKLPVSSFKLFEVIETNSKLTSPASSNKDSIVNPKRSTARSLRVSLNKFTASVMTKFDNTRVRAGSSRASKDSSSTPPITPTKVFGDELQNHSSLTPSKEKKRNKTKSPVIPSPFSLSTKEMEAAGKKKKLEEMFNDNDEAQNKQQHTKLKDKAKKNIGNLRHRFCFKARPEPEFHNRREASKRDIEKDPSTAAESPKQGRRPAPSIVMSKTSFNKPSLNNNGIKNFQGKSGGTLTLPLTSNPTTHENRSPNIQNGNPNDINYREILAVGGA